MNRINHGLLLLLVYGLLWVGIDSYSQLEASAAAVRTGPWKGSITVQVTAHVEGKDRSTGIYSVSKGSESLHCDFDDSRKGDNARCTYNSKGGTSSDKAWMETTGSANDASTHASVSFNADGSLAIGVSGFMGQSTLATSVANGDTENTNFGPFGYIIPAASASESGSWTDSSVSGMTTTVQWSITPVSQAGAPARQEPEPGEDEPKDTDVTLDGCVELGVGQQGTATAAGTPSGGRYRFWADPSTALKVTGRGSSATVTGTEPAQGTLHVQYTAPDGKTSQASKSATSLLIESINGGSPIPKIGLYDEMSKPTKALLTVPVSVKPDGAGDAVTYKLADPSFLTAMNQGNSILLQGVHEGKTTLQGSTQCGGPTGPVVTVEVVRCDDEVKAKIAEEEKIALEALKQQLEADGEIRNSEEFTKLDMTKVTSDLLIKTGSLIIGTLAAGPGGSHAVETAAQLITAGSGIMDTIEGGDPATAGFMTALMGLKNAIPHLLAEAYEVREAAEKFGESLGILHGTAEQLESIRKWIEEWGRKVEEIVKRKKFCREQTQQPPKQTDPQPTKKDPPPTRKPQPTTGQTPAPSDPPSGGQTGEPGGETTEPPSPPPPTSAVGPTGLPYSQEQGKCGCSKTPGFSKSSALTSSEGIAGISQGLGNLGQCTDQFNKGALMDFAFTLDDLKALLPEIESAAKAGPAEFKAAAPALGTRLNAVLGKTKDFNGAGQLFYSGFESCPAAVNSAVGVLSTAPAK